MNFVVVDHPRPGIALVTLNRPERMNAMAFDVMIPFRDALEEVSNDNSVRAVVITGAGRGFCSGADQRSAGTLPHVDGLTPPTVALRAMEMLDNVVLSLRRMHQPVISAINGAAIGGGLCLALASDIRIAAEDAYFRAAGINNGLTASELGLSYLLPRAIGSSRAFEIMLSGRDVHADEAERIGLVSRSVPGEDLLDECFDLAERMSRFSRPGLELTKRTLWSGLDAASLEAHIHQEGLGQLLVRLLTDNFEEATAARKDKREPQFRDRR
ncbi:MULTISPECIES: enoyl-CoA hydratase [unclassified Rhodococcus (in: high G+C Gram-positive bacteria)]|uniref:enoyl-CoA hydratase n=1 Tax=unclassified Rhodococcus (in: high G+C Gram-positive bacteria) TaxID=192944 RepID=UPI0016398885|nr:MULTISPECIES: enoyl-CoA hydratase [unclassified Rhodococcus (in: high G+C Gram-positive bacteria)]MBC2641434.1 enoyl-CoA hydratase [Rhodococcus sp. 3A]MBC2893821.1 enoyl-CoA hydratase [Rhodococcus sp. 4CII]